MNGIKQKHKSDMHYDVFVPYVGDIVMHIEKSTKEWSLHCKWTKYLFEYVGVQEHNAELVMGIKEGVLFVAMRYV